MSIQINIAIKTDFKRFYNVCDLLYKINKNKNSVAVFKVLGKRVLRGAKVIV